MHPNITTPLIPAERRTLRLVARNYSNLDIADKRGVTEHTVKNTLFEIYKKLGLRSRMEAGYYYMGSWHLIENWRKPPFVT